LFSTTKVFPTAAGADELPCELAVEGLVVPDELEVDALLLLLLVQPEAANATAPRTAIAVMDLRSISDSMDSVGLWPTIWTRRFPADDSKY